LLIEHAIVNRRRTLAIVHAMKFLKEIDDKPFLRDALYECKGLEELFETLKGAGYPFSGGEFEEAVDHVHVGCQSEADADVLMTRANWFRMVCANA